MPAAKPETETVEQPDPRPEQVGYCHQPDCPQQGVEVPLWRHVGTHPVLCQCGHLLSAHRPGEEPEVDEQA